MATPQRHPDAPVIVPAPAGDDLGAVVRARLRHTPPGPLLADRRATLVFQPDEPDAPAWTVVIDRGQLLARTGRPRRPTTVVRAPLDTLVGVVGGTESGVAAFLDGRVRVRGDLGLSLVADSLFDAVERPPRWTRSGVARAGKIATAYLEAGPVDAPPVVLLHGLGATNASWLPLLWDLAADHRVIAPDLPGFGASAKPRATYDAAFFAHWTEQLLDALHVETAVVCGNSLGGRIALEVGLVAPNRVRALVLLTPSPAWRRLRHLVPFARRVTPQLARLPLPAPHVAVVAGLRSMFAVPDRLAPAWYAAAADEFVRVFADPRARVAFFACARQIYVEQAYGEQGFWDRIPRLSTPSLFLWGDRDRLVPAAFARHVERALPAARSVVLESCGHVPQFEHPERTADLVRDFLSTVPI